MHLCQLLAVGLGVEWHLTQQHWAFVGSNIQLLVEHMMPDLLHVVPVGDDSVLNRVRECQDTSLALRLVADDAAALLSRETLPLGELPTNTSASSQFSAKLECARGHCPT